MDTVKNLDITNNLTVSFYPEFKKEDLVNLDKYRIYVKMTIDGKTSKPFSARRISEVVGRTYKGDVCKGLFLEDFRKDTLDGGRVQIISFRILKKWKRNVDQPRIVYADVIIDMNDKPFIEYIRRWWNHLYDLRRNIRQKYMPISRSRAYQIVREIDDRIIGPHWFRHQRLSHLAETLSPFQLNERIGFWESIDPAIAYVHGSVGKYLEACKKARRRNK